MTENYLYPNIPQSVWIVILLIILTIGIGVILGIFESVIGFPSLQHHAVLALINLIAFGLILARGLKRANSSLREICPLVPVRLSLLFPMTLTVIGTIILLSEVDNLLRTFLPPLAWFTKGSESLEESHISLWGSIVSLVVVAPLTEELLMRGLILRGFLSHYSTRKAILVSAVLFGLLHLNPWQFIAATILGILFAWWFIETRSMLPCFFGHALANALPLTVTTIFQLEISGFTGGFGRGKVEFQPLWFDCVGFVLAALGVWLLIHQFRKSNNTVPGILIGHESDE